MRSREPIAPGGTLPVSELPSVQRQERREYRKRAPLLKRIGHTALENLAGVVTIATNPQTFFKSPEAIKESAKTGKGLNFLGRAAARKWVIKAENRQEELRKHRRAARNTAVTDFRDKYPNVALQEADLQKEWQRQENVRLRKKIFTDISRRSSFATEYFQRRSAYSFSKSLPRRTSYGTEKGFEGNYADLARDTLQSALTYRKKDGSIPLLGRDITTERFKDKESSRPVNLRQSEEAYVEGVSTAMWQLGFVQFENERQINYGSGTFNPDITWERSPDGVSTTASLAFDPENELHQMIMPEGSNFSNPQVQVEISGGNMDLRVAEAAVPTMATAA